MLIDTNIFIEIGRKQEKAQQCSDFFDAIRQDFISDATITPFSLSALQYMLAENDRALLRNILLLIHQEKIKTIPLDNTDQLMILSLTSELNLDFDDCTQFVAANKLSVPLVTFDTDFKKTGLQTITPQEVLDDVLL